MLLSFVLIQLVQLFVATESFRQSPPYVKRSSSFTRLHNSEDGSSILNEGYDTSKSNGLDQCPFSKSFGRYQVSLSSTSKLKRNEPPGFQLFPFQKSFSESVARSQIEKRLLSGEKLIWTKNLDGVAAFSFLWEQASRLIHDNDGPSSEIVALPDAAPSLVQNWVEIVEWMNNQPELVPSGAASILVSLLAESENVPAVRIQRVASSRSAIDCADDPSITITSDQVVAGTRLWVKRILVDQGICPFTKSDRKSGQGLSDVGVPVGGILYSTSFATDPIQLQANTWNTIEQMLEAGPSGKGGISSILLAAPYFDDNFDLWAGPIFAMLEAGVVAAQAQQQVGVVCFHPLYATPDGTSWPGFGHMHSVPRLAKWHKENGDPTTALTTEEIAAGGAWQRRTPHATINVLRADQLEAAESRRTTGKLYAENIEKLVGRKNGIGSTKLAEDLAREQRIGLD